MQPSRHLLTSTVAGSGVWAMTGESWALPIVVTAGVLVDLDHGPDAWWNVALERKPIVTLAFHAWEWLISLVLLGVWTGFSWWLTAAIIGYGLHLFTDQIANKRSLGI